MGKVKVLCGDPRVNPRRCFNCDMRNDDDHDCAGRSLFSRLVCERKRYSELQAAAARENGRKGGRPRLPDDQLKSRRHKSRRKADNPAPPQQAQRNDNGDLFPDI